MVKIRKAAISDCKYIVILLDQLGYPTTKEELEKRFIEFIKIDGYGVVVAEIDDELVGFVAWSKSRLFVSDAVRIHIEGLVVDEKHRGKNIGKKLMQFVEDISKVYDCVIVDLTSGLRRKKDGSHDFYNNLGYKNEGHLAKLYLRKIISK